MERETLGAAIRKRRFFVHVAICLLFDFVIIVYSLKDLWSEFYYMHTSAAYGLVVGNCLGLFATNFHMISWILVDENCWLERALLLLFMSVPLTICGAYFTIKYFNHQVTFHTCRGITDKHNVEQRYRCSKWIPVLAGINFLQGILGCIFSAYVCVAFDEVNRESV